jgi:hypothetical protein
MGAGRGAGAGAAEDSQPTSWTYLGARWSTGVCWGGGRQKEGKGPGRVLLRAEQPANLMNPTVLQKVKKG